MDFRIVISERLRRLRQQRNRFGVMIEKDTGWDKVILKVGTGREETHQLPKNDSERHNKHQRCRCKPACRLYGNNVTVTHNAFDGRPNKAPFIAYRKGV